VPVDPDMDAFEGGQPGSWRGARRCGGAGTHVKVGVQGAKKDARAGFPSIARQNQHWRVEHARHH
jgi:hypothetical protein